MAKKKQREDIINFTAEDRYVKPTDPAILKELEWFKDQKLAFMVHWGVYSEMGMCESWPLSDGDAYWARKGVNWVEDGEDMRKKYFAMNKTFNPLRFNPDEWADFAKAAGFRYFIFTTKHHDGFCMYDTKYSDYKVTAEDCPFHTHKYANIAKVLFDAFRKRGIAIAPYFSKPDWHCPWYWAPDCEKPIAYDRNPTYDPEERPDLWDKYVEFTHNQLTEIAEELGPVKILWLDGGQVNPANGQDVRLRDLAPKLREKFPGLLFADRTVGGEFENYITPEGMYPDHIMDVPWESCIPVGGGFAFTFDADYHTPRELAHMLIKVTTRGGNLALNLGAQPDGRLPRHGMEAALGLGRWLSVYGEAIYETRAARTSLEADDWGFNTKADSVYAIKPLGEKEFPRAETLIPWDKPVKKAVFVKTGEEIPFENTEKGVLVTLPLAYRNGEEYAIVVKLDM